MSPSLLKRFEQWPSQRDAFVNALVALMHKHFPEKIAPCPDCGMLSLHLCENAFRDMSQKFFDKVYEHGVRTALTELKEEMVAKEMKISEQVYIDAARAASVAPFDRGVDLGWASGKDTCIAILDKALAE